MTPTMLPIMAPISELLELVSSGSPVGFDATTPLLSTLVVSMSVTTVLCGSINTTAIVVLGSYINPLLVNLLTISVLVGRTAVLFIPLILVVGNRLVISILVGRTAVLFIPLILVVGNKLVTSITLLMVLIVVSVCAAVVEMIKNSVVAIGIKNDNAELVVLVHSYNS